MNTFWLFVLFGLGPGAVYALLAEGIVLIQRGSGVVNFAQGALGMFAAYTFIHFTGDGMGLLNALLLTVALAAIGGAVIYAKIMRPLRDAPLLGRLVATLGLLLALNGAAQLIYTNGSAFAESPEVLPHYPVHVFGATIGVDRFYLVGIAIAAAVGLWALYRFTRFGLATRAAAENEKGALLLGYSPDTVGAVNWALGVALAALGGILIAPLVSVSTDTYTLLIVPALAAALLGRFSSFGLTAAAAIGIGIAESLIGQYVPNPSGLAAALPFVIVILAMVVQGRLIPGRGMLNLRRPPLATLGRVTPLRVAVLLGIVILLTSTLNSSYQDAIATSMITSIIMLSVVVVTGYAGQLSLAQLAFAGIGGLAVSLLGETWGIPFPWSLLLAALICVPVGVLVGLPALRVRGINLAVVTLGAAYAADELIFNSSYLTGGDAGRSVPVPALFGYSFDPLSHPNRFVYLCFGILLLVVLGVSGIRRGASGRRMLAVRDNERAAAALGVNITATKLGAFAFSAFLAGLGGALFGFQLQQISFARFATLNSGAADCLCVPRWHRKHRRCAFRWAIDRWGAGLRILRQPHSTTRQLSVALGRSRCDRGFYRKSRWSGGVHGQGVGAHAGVCR